MSLLEKTAPWQEAQSTPETLNDGSELELVARAQKGDADAFSELVVRHQSLVFNLAFRFMRNRTAAEDAAQDAFIKAFRLLKGFRGDCSFSTWLYRVTVSVCLTELSRCRKRNEVTLLPMHEVQGHVEPERYSDMPELVRRCVAKLPPRYATIITLYYLKEISYDDIASVLRIPMGTLKTWMHRARHELRRIVEREMATDEKPWIG